MDDQFLYDVFIGYSAKDVVVVRQVANRLRADGLRVWYHENEIQPKHDIRLETERGLEQSRVLLLCISKNTTSWALSELESYTSRFSDPVNLERRLIVLKLAESAIAHSLVQFPHIRWFDNRQDKEYARLFTACRPAFKLLQPAVSTCTKYAFKLDKRETINAFSVYPRSNEVLIGTSRGVTTIFDLADNKNTTSFRSGDMSPIIHLDWNPQGTKIVSINNDLSLRIFGVAPALSIFETKLQGGHPRGLLYSSNGQHLLVATPQRLQIWSISRWASKNIFQVVSDKEFIACIASKSVFAATGHRDGSIRVWNIQSFACLYTLTGHAAEITEIDISIEQRVIVSSSFDNTVRVWSMATGQCLRIFQEHTAAVYAVRLSPDQKFAISSADDGTVRLMQLGTGASVLLGEHDKSDESVVFGLGFSADQHFAYSASANGTIYKWDISKIIPVNKPEITATPHTQKLASQLQYTNAKVVLVGDTSSGKTGLAYRLSTGNWRHSDASTVGAWSTQWKLGNDNFADNLQREIWLWDFGGQADQRLVHQLFLDRSALILLLFNSDQDDVLPGLRDWLMALSRSVPPGTPYFLVAGRIDAGFKASREKLKYFSKENKFQYYETSALENIGCKELRDAIITSIPWDRIPVITTEHLFKTVKDEIIKLRDEGTVLCTFKELRDVLFRRLPSDVQLSGDVLRTVVGHLDAPGIVKELDYGTYILLQPEWLNAYAQAVIRTLRSDEKELGCLRLQSIAEGKLLYQGIGRDGKIENMKRLPAMDERVVLAEMERQLLDRGLCLRQGDKIVFPSHCGRDRPAVVKHPAVFVSYMIKGYLDDIYATLVVKLADTEAFNLSELWRDAADFETLEGGQRMGVKLTRTTGSEGEISVYFGPGVSKEEQVIFANYIHAHLDYKCEETLRLRYYVCPACNTPKGNPQVLMEKLIEKKQQADTECDKCGHRFKLWDALEKKFASEDVRRQVEELQANESIRLDSRRKGKLLALEVAARITSADQKCHEIPGTEDEGIDMQLEFTDENGKGTAKYVHLQLKAGNSYLEKRKDGIEIFKIKKQSWVKYWLAHTDPVMLVIGTFPDENARLSNRERREFEDVRWMNISNYLREATGNGKKTIKQIEFKGERLDATSVIQLRNAICK